MDIHKISKPDENLAKIVFKPLKRGFGYIIGSTLREIFAINFFKTSDVVHKDIRTEGL